eukprot:scaffold964_cov261-Pinguiococcus_pyrenoidosus.AAC.21
MRVQLLQMSLVTFVVVGAVNGGAALHPDDLAVARWLRYRCGQGCRGRRHSRRFPFSGRCSEVYVEVVRVQTSVAQGQRHRQAMFALPRHSLAYPACPSATQGPSVKRARAVGEVREPCPALLADERGAEGVAKAATVPLHVSHHRA